LYGRDKKFHRIFCIESQVEENPTDSREIIYQDERSAQLASNRIWWLCSVLQRRRFLGTYCKALRQLINFVIPKIICNVLDASVI
jgi:hypothetical protein